MKKLLLFLIMGVFFATACSKIDEGDQNLSDGDNPSIELGASVEQEIVLDSDGGSETIRFTSSQSWYIECAEDASWLDLSPVEGEPGNGRVKVKAQANTSGAIRRSEFKLCSGTLSITFSVIQDNFELMFEVPETEMHVSAAGGLIRIPINTNMDFDVVSGQDWIIPTTSRAKRPDHIVAAVKPNLTSSARTSEITVSCDMGEAVVTVIQDAVDGYLSQFAEKSFMSRSLAVRFTADWCGYCPYMATAFDSAKAQMDDAFEIISLHGSESAYEFYATSQLERRFGVSSYPTGIIDFRASIPNNSSTAVTASTAVQVAQETKSSYPTTSGIAVDSFISGTELIVFVPIYFHQADSYRVTVLLLEDGIVGYQNGKGSRYTHNDVARKNLTSMLGESARIESANTVWTQIYTTNVEASWNPENLKVLVYVEKPYGDQPKVESVGYADYLDYRDTYIDNCRAVKVGEMANIELK